MAIKSTFEELINCRFDQSSINLVLNSLKQRMAIPYQIEANGTIRDGFAPFGDVKRGDTIWEKLDPIKC